METQENYKNSYPELSEDGKKRTQAIIDKFSNQITDLVNNTIRDFTCNLSEEIVGDDSWIDIRRKTLEALCGYSDSERALKQAGTYEGQWWTAIRKKILEENREAIVNDIILDKEAEIERLKETINQLQRLR